MNRKDGRTGKETISWCKEMPVRTIAANSEALFPEARATKKIVLKNRSCWDRFASENLKEEKASRTTLRDQAGIFLVAGGFCKN